MIPSRNKKISVIVAAYNEEPRIGKVLKVLEKHPLCDEVLVIDDGSKDGTVREIKKYKVTLVQNENNMGKTRTVKRGIEMAKNDLIMMIDADLVGLDSECITNLAEPVLNGEVDWTLSLRKNSLWYMKLLGVDWISGERVVPKEMFDDPVIWSRSDVSYGLESLMNKSFLAHKKSFYSVWSPCLVVTNKADKIGFWKGNWGEVRMIWQINKVLPLPLMFWQFFRMAYLNKKYHKMNLSHELSET